MRPADFWAEGDIFAYDVAYAKNQILQTIISNSGTWFSWKAIGNLEVTQDKLKTETRLKVLVEAAAEQGVGAEAWFAAGTPIEVLRVAQQVVGPENVYVFDE